MFLRTRMHTTRLELLHVFVFVVTPIFVLQEAFLEREPGYGYNGAIDELREREFSRLKGAVAMYVALI